MKRFIRTAFLISTGLLFLLTPSLLRAQPGDVEEVTEEPDTEDLPRVRPVGPRRPAPPADDYDGPPRTTPAEVARLVERLTAVEPSARDDAIDKLIAIGDPALPRLRSAARSTNPVLRRWAGVVLAELE